MNAQGYRWLGVERESHVVEKEMTVTPDESDPLTAIDESKIQRLLTALQTPIMSELRNRILAPPPPRHPNVRPPSPNSQPRSTYLNLPPPPVHPAHPPLPPRPPPNPQPDARLDYFSPEPIPSQVASPVDVLHTPRIQRLSPPVLPNRPSNLRSFSENVVASTSGVDVKPVGIPAPPPKHTSISPELPPPVSRTSSFNSITGSQTTPPPAHHTRKARSLTSDSAYEATLSEKELRDLYDDEEIDRFLHLFSAHVNEVKLNDGGHSTVKVEFSAATDGIVVEDNDDKDWLSLNEVGENLGLPHDGHQPQTISEQIAQKSIVPHLPKTTKTIPPFTVNRLLLMMQRLYLALEPGYQFFVDNLISLALWEDKNRSLRFCLGYWVLWANNLLLPSPIFYLLYVLLYRRMHPYPSLAQLREHRGQIDKASEFGEELQARLTAATPFGVLDAWKTLKVYNKNRVRKAKEKIKQSDDAASVMSAETVITDNDILVVDDSVEKTHEQDVKALGLEALCELADGLERLKNLFLWRKSSVSYSFSIALGVMGFATLTLPAQWLTKIVYFVLGFSFWHVPPILVALPAGDHRRLLMLTHNVPTDADYAMELIAQRVARGQEIKPLNRKRKHTKKFDADDSPDILSRDPDEDDKPKGFLKHSVSVLKTVADTGYQAIGGQRFIHNNFAPAAVRDAGPQDSSRFPGVITVSIGKFYFTPLLSGPKLEVPAEDIVGIKKATPKGISIRVKDASQEGGERKEKFLLVYERDELFGRLVGAGGKKWMRI
ncbi:hypothetical protein BDM02DRAFT_138295 [Thelephora ganbajun]|uniref:Uncharacterized protein n=1 Tax=Thelephora ganbajun TaxID=370292 RepID=A0ACB6ZXI7_THEGA|nr:hypothetical protein BDM02DRAFT_138295 [Thelephora ganbajun]